MILPLFLMLAAQAGPIDTDGARFDRCAALVRTDPAAALAEATRWSVGGGTWLPRQCAGLAYAAQAKFDDAARSFENAAAAARTAQDDHAARLFAQAGNAWLAAGDAAKARAALDSALVQGTLTGLQLGEARLDHARALVAAGEPDTARRDIDLALQSAPEDPLAWLLSATLARRMGDPKRAATDIAEALSRSPDDASVQLEAGNIAALAGNAARAQAAWAEAARIAPTTPVGRSARAALAQFATTPAPATTPARPATTTR